MEILILAHYGQQPPQNTMRRYHNWGKELVSRGYKVTIIAASSLHNTNIDYVDLLGTDSSEFEGVKYQYIKTQSYSGNGLGRMRNMLQYCIGIRRFSYFDPDIIIIGEAYLFGFARNAFKNTPIITDTADLWPESIVEYAGFSRENPLIKYLYHIEKKAYISSDALIFSMEGGIDYLNEQSYTDKINYNKVFHINMGCDLKACDQYLEEFKEDLPWNMSKFNIVYCGSIRPANQVSQICEAAKELQKQGIDSVEFQIYGNGDQLESLEKYVKENRLSNVHFYGRFKKENIPGILSHANASLLTYKQVHLMKYGGSQSKLFDYLASGTPIICNAKWGYNLIERYNCGVVTEDQTPEAFVKAIKHLLSMSEEEIAQMGQNGRKVAEMYDQPQLVDKLCEVLEYATSRKE